MLSDRDIWERASGLVHAHGADANIHAGFKADAALAKGDVEAEREWLRIIKAVAWLTSEGGRDPFRVEH